MNKIVRALIVVCFSIVAVANAEVGQTDVIDSIATKPDSNVAILLLFQERPWTKESFSLLSKKLAFYKLTIDSGQLAKQKPAISNKKLRVIIVYQSVPGAEFEIELKELQTAFGSESKDLYWGTQNEMLELAKNP